MESALLFYLNKVILEEGQGQCVCPDTDRFVSQVFLWLVD